MIKGTKITVRNTSQVGTAGNNTGGSAITMYSVPSGKTFILTDLVCDWNGADNMTTTNSNPGIALLDASYGGSTVGTYTQSKIMFKQPPNCVGLATGTVQTLVVTGLSNGPGFTTAVSALNLSTMLTIPAYGVKLIGYVV